MWNSGVLCHTVLNRTAQLHFTDPGQRDCHDPPRLTLPSILQETRTLHNSIKHHFGFVCPFVFCKKSLEEQSTEDWLEVKNAFQAAKSRPQRMQPELRAL